MKLRDVMGRGPDDVEIGSLAYDNRSVEPGALFFCVPGFTRDGHDFAPDAVAARRGRARRQRALGLEECPRCWFPTSAPRWRRPPRASTAIPPPGCAWWA